MNEAMKTLTTAPELGPSESKTCLDGIEKYLNELCDGWKAKSMKILLKVHVDGAQMDLDEAERRSAQVQTVLQEGELAIKNAKEFHTFTTKILMDYGVMDLDTGIHGVTPVSSLQRAHQIMVTQAQTLLTESEEELRSTKESLRPVEKALERINKAVYIAKGRLEIAKASLRLYSSLEEPVTLSVC